MSFELKAWLEQIQMGMYLKHFEVNGCTDWDAISLLTDEDLKEIQITMLGHRKKIMHSIAQKKQEAEREVVAEQPSFTQVKIYVAEDHFEVFTCGPDTTVAMALPVILQAFDVQPQSWDDVALHVRSGGAALPLTNGEKILEFINMHKGDLWLLSGTGIPMSIEAGNFPPLDKQANALLPQACSQINMGPESANTPSPSEGFVTNAAQQKYYTSGNVPLNIGQYYRTQFVHQPFAKSDPTLFQHGTLTNFAVYRGHRRGYFGTGSRRYRRYSTSAPDPKEYSYGAHTENAADGAGNWAFMACSFVITAAFIALDTILAIRKYWKKETAALECAEAIAKSFVVKTGGAIGAVAGAMGAAYALSFMTPFGLLVWAVPIVGSALGYAAGATAAEKLFNAATDRIHKWLNKPQMAVLKDAYDFLGVNSDDPNSVIERRFRELARIYHPDKGGDAEMMTKLSVYIEIIRCYREHRAYFKDSVLLLGMDETTRLTH